MRLNYKDCTIFQIRKGDFPLDHTFIIQVSFCEPSPVRKQYLTCDSESVESLSLIISSIANVNIVKSWTVDNFPL